MLFGLNFHILGLFRKFEIGRKTVKNRGLTPLLFGKIFRPQKLSQKLEICEPNEPLPTLPIHIFRI